MTSDLTSFRTTLRLQNYPFPMGNMRQIWIRGNISSSIEMNEISLFTPAFDRTGNREICYVHVVLIPIENSTESASNQEMQNLHSLIKQEKHSMIYTSYDEQSVIDSVTKVILWKEELPKQPEYATLYILSRNEESLTRVHEIVLSWKVQQANPSLVDAC
jgi:hypothetical protein